MIYTSIYGLKKPEDTDSADLRVFVGDNMDLLESSLERKAKREFIDGQNVTTSGWYRIAETNGDRAYGSFLLSDKQSGLHHVVKFEFAYAYGNAGSLTFNVTANSNFGGDGLTFTRFRILQGGTYDPAYIEVYIDLHAQTIVSGLDINLYENEWENGINLIPFTAGLIPTGYTATEYDNSALGEQSVKGNVIWHGGNFDPTLKSNVGHSHAWTEVTGKPTTFTPPLASALSVGGGRVGNGLAMSGEYLYVRTGTGLLIDANYAVSFDTTYVVPKATDSDNLGGIEATNYIRKGSINDIQTALEFNVLDTFGGLRITQNSVGGDPILHLKAVGGEWTMRNDDSAGNLLDFRFNNVSQFSVTKDGVIAGTIDTAQKANQLQRLGSILEDEGYYDTKILNENVSTIASSYYIGYFNGIDWYKLNAGNSDKLGGSLASAYFKTGVSSEAPLIVNGVDSHIQLQNGGTTMYHIETRDGELSFVETGVVIGMTLNGSWLYLGSGGAIATKYNNSYMLRDHGNGNVTLSATGSELYLGYHNTSQVRISSDLFSANGKERIITQDGSQLSTHNPLNYSASCHYGWMNNIPRMRWGGTGAGSVSGFQFQGSGDTIRAWIKDDGFMYCNGSAPLTGNYLIRGGGYEFQFRDLGSHQAIYSTGNCHLKWLSSSFTIQVRSNTDGAYGTLQAVISNVSDRRLKRNIQVVEESLLEQVENSTVYSFNMEGHDDNKIFYGLITDEAPKQIVIPANSEDEHESINLYEMSSFLWKALQELSQKNKCLQTEVELLKQKIESLS